MKTALLQLTSSDDPAANLDMVRGMVAEAAAQGARWVLTPEVTNCVSNSTTRQREVLQHEEDDITLAGLRAQATELGIWLLIGSLGLKTHDADGRFANRSFMIGPDGGIVARYDKIHMFDVQVTETETFRESANYRPGDRAVLAPTEFGTVGMTICYDLRFPHLHAALAQAGATVLTVPAAFSPVTGAAHWESLLRARAIETGCWVLAPAQTGTHPNSRGKPRRTHGHSLVVAPWGEVRIDAGSEPGIHIFDLDDTSVTEARRRVPSLTHKRAFDGP
ncbi:carbon-nitrogen hydrolase family protein [Ruegeria pomeroyi]|jgi:predicted amidohydrolase|uniref:Hydrolase, carbon-nitrogen family n=2 Tax=Ruegeria pomeroyi TaxID=89184 RepID=Q5LWM4_RUEPO|nr:carbon-nitrogen hydrolase family protein [Ruegeria pomeroyi]HCE70386.1 carbon-nitrogen hydrolase family protein [Ruegeria sp.]AAV93400.1 hydrolase, carbon-nitrogen family [Ruegeria pomeroyi DSS-3]NVK99029.1 carbon-nitrogen hydrolase family protein [Ruegeria pomeroyi]NVL00761.1 carbon-nitrogen hydrolase family protein [Ruegeria pomeroyi]QWV10696.1 carbon-nitrogen hydrolase family protein [Ruegeria pomeroyi]